MINRFIDLLSFINDFLLVLLRLWQLLLSACLFIGSQQSAIMSGLETAFFLSRLELLVLYLIEICNYYGCMIQFCANCHRYIISNSVVIIIQLRDFLSNHDKEFRKLYRSQHRYFCGSQIISNSVSQIISNSVIQIIFWVILCTELKQGVRIDSILTP